MSIIDRRGITVDGTPSSAAAYDPNANKAIKTPCRVATTANITLSGLQSIDGVTVAADDRVLVKDQTDATENGIYKASSGNWTRATDTDGAYDLVDGTIVQINDGTVSALRQYICTSSDPLIPGTSSLSFSANGYQPLDATLTALAGAASAANKLPYFSGVDTVALADFTAAGRALIDDATAAAQRTTLGVSAAIPGETTLEEYGGSGDGTTDNVAAITAIHTAGIQTIRLGAGKVYKFASAIPTITYGMSIIGDTMSSSVLDFYQTTGSCIYYTGTAGGGGRLEGFSIRNKGAATLTAAIKLEAQAAGGSPDYCLIENVNITGATNADLYQYGILLDGTLRIAGTVGIRNITVHNVKTFNTTVNAFEIRYGKDIQINGSFFATGTGGVNSGKITGAGSGTESNIVRLDADMGDLALDYAINVLADGVFNAVTTTANTSYFNIFGKAVSATINASSTYGRLTFQQGATITNNSTSTFVMDRSGVFLDASAALNFSAGDVTIQHATNALTITGASNGFFTEYLIAPSVSDGAALGSATYMWSDLFVASGAALNFNNGDVTLQHATNALTITGASNGFFTEYLIAPSVSDGAALGSATYMWSDLFVASGAALNFNNGDVTLQHAANALTVTGATNGFFSENLIAPSVTDGAALGSTTYMWSDLFLASGGILNWNNADVRIIHAANTLTFDGASNGYFFTHLIAPSASDGAALGSTTYMWSDLFLASGSVINWNNGDVTQTHAADTMTWAGATVYDYTDGLIRITKSGTTVLNGVYVRTTNTGTAETHTSKFEGQDNNAGTIRALFAAAGPLNAGTADQGQFDIINENGTIFMMQLSTLAANGGARMNLYDRSGNADIRLDTNALSYFRGGPLEATELRASADVGGAASQISHTNTSDVTANSTGVGTILFKGTTNRNSSGFAKIYIGTTAYYVPVFSAITG